MRAGVLIRDHPTARREPFCEGLRALGFDVVTGKAPEPRPGDALVIWNRRAGQGHEIARQYEAAGAAVIVAENAYIGALPTDCRLYALALNHHNGAGRWHVGGEDRWSRLGVEVKPWRREGDHILVLPQRGIGEPGVAMPQGWPDSMRRYLPTRTRRPVRVRVHPGNLKTHHVPGLYDDLRGAHAVVTWGSGAAIKAICAGIPVFHELPRWIGAPAARPLMGGSLEEPWTGGRQPMLHRLAWAQWTVEEIASGEPFRHLLRLAEKTAHTASP